MPGAQFSKSSEVPSIHLKTRSFFVKYPPIKKSAPALKLFHALLFLIHKKKEILNLIE
jgi:hypothetical protein